MSNVPQRLKHDSQPFTIVTGMLTDGYQIVDRHGSIIATTYTNEDAWHIVKAIKEYQYGEIERATAQQKEKQNEAE